MFFVDAGFADEPKDDTCAAFKTWVNALQSTIGGLKGFGTGENKYATRNLIRAVAGRFVTPAILRDMSLADLDEWYDVDNKEDKNIAKIAHASPSGLDTRLATVGEWYGIEAHHLCRLFCQLRGFEEAWQTPAAAEAIKREVAAFKVAHRGLEPTVGKYKKLAKGFAAVVQRDAER